MTSFKTALQWQLDAGGLPMRRSKFGKGAVKVIGNRLAIKLMERVARSHLGVSQGGDFNWETIDWEAMLPLLKEIQPLIMEKFGL